MSSRIPRVPSRLLPALAALALGSASATLPVSVAQADELIVPQTEQPAASQSPPRRGMSMQAVQSLFGAPAKRIPAVGQPPISRWEYSGFVVYFENDRVLHSVIKG